MPTTLPDAEGAAGPASSHPEIDGLETLSRSQRQRSPGRLAGPSVPQELDLSLVMRTTVARLLVLGSLGLASSDAAADSISCDGGIVSVGDSRLDLLAKCGQPALQETEPVLTTTIVDLSLLIERWTYNYGPQRFTQIVSLKGGKIVAIERGGYGYALPEPPKDAPKSPLSIPRARCDPGALRIGDRTFDVLARCGEPVSRDLDRKRRSQRVIEVWTYDFGQRSFVRFLEFESGRLVRIRTGSYGYSQ